ncbi:putative component of anaerobic dehydrogenases [Desulfitobacterium sp. LBE]|uniref:TorD/DmsD family molecular chaperone n=1 Tax=Desulfitobacterium sp. LBE TaxID=884086 RepID=UPI00119ABA35|nr:molecular chaperone TorD family protein [Desulfitobacterium sp. LBE]TWH59999.1 putative component of anaerobic dehydrogenases [Desulfitobacterium sp. LBE]
MSNNRQEQDAMNAFTISDFFQLLSISLRLPNHELAQAFLDGSYGRDALYILEELSCTQEEIASVREALKNLASTEEDVTAFLIQMRREYTRLFDDPKKPAVSIYETLFVHNSEDKGGVMLFMSPAALDAERCYKSAGVSLVKQSAEPADHMATELEFMMYLYAKKGKALQEESAEELAVLEKQIKEFTDLHLHKWCRAFFDKLACEAGLTFYQGLCRLGQVGLSKILA